MQIGMRIKKARENEKEKKNRKMRKKMKKFLFQTKRKLLSSERRMSVEEREVQEEKEDNNDEVELQIRRKHQVLSSFRRRIPRVARMESGHQQNASGEAAEESDHEIQLECPLL